MKRTRSLFSIITLSFLLLSSTFAQEELTNDQSADLLGGFLDGLGIDSDIKEEGLVEAGNLVNAINLLEGDSQKDALDGLKIIGGIMDRLPSIIDNIEGNDGADDYFLNEMEEIAADLENIDAYEEGANTSDLVVRNVSITALVNEASTQLTNGDHYEAGWAIGDALSDIYTANTPPASQEVLDQVSSKAQEWEAGPAPEELSNFKSLDEFAKSKLGVPESVVKNATKNRRRLRRAGIRDRSIYRKQDLPENFDPREKWPNCIGKIRSQGVCGSCWAFAGTEAFADRVCIASGGKVRKVLSPQYMVNCGPEDMGMSACDGGSPAGLFQYFEQNGVWQDSCLVYTSGDQPQRNECPSTCQDGSTPNVIYGKSGTQVQFDNTRINDIKHELMTNGPLVTVFQAYDDFTLYKKGIYSHTTGGNPGGHAVKLLGWGKDPNTGTEYWLCANSWGAGWGDNGYFKIKFGDSDINMEVDGMIPDLKRSVLTNNNGADMPDEDNSGNTGGAELWGGDKGDGGNGNGEQSNPDNGNGEQPNPDNGDGEQPFPDNGTEGNFGNQTWNEGDFGNDSWNEGDFGGDNDTFGNDSWGTENETDPFGGDNSSSGDDNYWGNNNNDTMGDDSNFNFDDQQQGMDDQFERRRKGLRGIQRKKAIQRRRSVQRRRSTVQRKTVAQRRRTAVQRKGVVRRKNSMMRQRRNTQPTHHTRARSVRKIHP